MLAALNLGALLLGIVSGGLVASVFALALGGFLTLVGVASGADIGLVVGIVAGLAAGGWVAGSRARHSSRFHGAVTGLALAFVITAIAIFGGSPAGATTVVWLALVSIIISGAAGWLSGRRKTTPT